MYKLRYGYVMSGIVMGLVLLWQFVLSLPDGKLRITICDVGQGDGIYLRFPDGRDMLIDSGPASSALLSCLGRTMPWWDRKISVVMLTHPDKDHSGGMGDILRRFQVETVIRSESEADTEVFRGLLKTVEEKHIPVRLATAGDQILIGSVGIDFFWPSSAFVAQSKGGFASSSPQVLGAITAKTNDFSLVFSLRYGNFDALFTGDADMRVEEQYKNFVPPGRELEILKVPHHGSATGISEKFIQELSPRTAVISVGKRNTYGHPSPIILDRLEEMGSRIVRTDINGDITISSDGKTYSIFLQKEYGILQKENNQ